MRRHLTNSDKLTWLANQIFTAFPEEVSGLKFYVLDCGCIYYQRIYKDGSPDPQVGIYRDGEDGACKVCMTKQKTWRDRVIDQTVIYDDNFAISSCR